MNCARTEASVALTLWPSTSASSDQDGSLELREPTTLDVVTGIERLPHPVKAPGFTRDGSLMVTADDLAGGARLWRMDGLEQSGGPIDGIGGTIHPDGSQIVVAATRRCASPWTPMSGFGRPARPQDAT